MRYSGRRRRAIPQIECLEPRVVLSSLFPNDPRFSSQWGLNNSNDVDIDAPEAWGIVTGGSVIVAEIGVTGVDITHPDLANKLWTNPDPYSDPLYPGALHGWDFAANSPNLNDSSGHDTNAVGIMAAETNNLSNPQGIAGVSWGAQLMLFKIQYNSQAAAAVDFAVAHGAKVIEMGFIYGSSPGSFSSDPLYLAIQRAASSGVVVVVPVGNGGLSSNTGNPGQDLSTLTFFAPAPAAFRLPNMINVAAINSTGSLSSFSNFGATTVDLAAPGENITTTGTGHGYIDFAGGTSFAAPFVAGVAALVRSQHPEFTAQQVVQRILSTTKPLSSLSGKTITGGIADAYYALRVDLPAIPAGLSATPVSPSQINLSWNAAAGATGYTVERSPNGSTSWTTVGTPTGTSFQDSSLSPLTTYYYRIRANNAYGTSDPSATASATTQQSSASFPKKFDFGTPTSPVASGYTRVTAATAYTTGLGYGWTAGSGSDVDRGTGFGIDLTRDSFQTEGATFEVDVPNGTYDVTLVVGDSGPYSHDTQNFYLEGTLAASITTAQYEVKTEVHTVTVADGKLTIRIEDHNGNNWDTVLCALEIRPASATGQALGRAMTPTSTEIGFQASNAVNGDSSAYRSSGQWTRSDSIGWITGSTWVPVTTSPRSSSTGRSPTPRFSGFRSAMTRATGRRSSPSSPTSVVASRSTTAYQAEGATRASTAPLPARPTTLNSSARE